MNIVVIGAGAWGTALAMSAASRGDGRVVTLWARDAAQAQAMHGSGENARYLPGVLAAVPHGLRLGSVTRPQRHDTSVTARGRAHRQRRAPGACANHHYVHICSTLKKRR